MAEARSERIGSEMSTTFRGSQQLPLPVSVVLFPKVYLLARPDWSNPAMCFVEVSGWVFGSLLSRGTRGTGSGGFCKFLDGDLGRLFPQHTLYGSRRDAVAFGDLP
jgi:hypothetical protein